MIAAILDTGKYGPYLWGSFGLAVAIYAWNWLAPRLARRQILRSLADS